MAFLQGSRFAPAMALGQRARFVQQGRLLSTIEGSGDAVADPAVAAAREARKEEKAAQKAAQKAKKAANAPAAAGAAPGAVNDKIVTPRAEDYSKWYQVRRRQTQLFEIERAVRVA
jgi:pyruvate/2-oxoglutarate dehydrogenase complex dihydrolipoamide acyltransferase (E2) component